MLSPSADHCTGRPELSRAGNSSGMLSPSTDHCTGRPELSRAGNSSGMLSPSADQHSGHIAMRDCAACSTCNSKETLSPSVDHCCGQTVRHKWRRWSPSTDYCCGQTVRHEWRRCLPPQTTAVVRL